MNVQYQSHPYYAMFQQRLNIVINNLVAQGRINQQEAAIIPQLLPRMQNYVDNFVGGLISSYSNMSPNQMDACIMNNLLPALVNNARQVLMQQAQQYMGGYQQSMMQPVFGGGFQQPQMGWGGGFGRPMFNSGFGQGGMYTGGPVQQLGAPNFSPRPQQPTGMFVNQQQTMDQQTPQQQPVSSPTTTTQEKEPALWEPPKYIEDKEIKLDSGKIKMNGRQFKLSSGKKLNRFIVLDKKNLYASGREAIDAYMNVANLLPVDKNTKKFITIIHSQLRLVKAPFEETAKLAREITEKFSEEKVKTAKDQLVALTSILDHYPVGVVKGFTDFLMDEFNMHFRAGELVRTTNPTAILEINSLSGILDILRHQLSDEMEESLKSITGFHEKFRNLVDDFFGSIVKGLHKSIVDVGKSQKLFHIINHVLPKVWAPYDVDISSESVEVMEDLEEMYAATQATVGGNSKADSAVDAEVFYKGLLGKINSNFTIVGVHRTTSFTDIPKSNVVGYNPDGSCIPTCVTETTESDIGFFCREITSTLTASKLVNVRLGVASVTCECGEEQFVLDYGQTLDGATWVGSTKGF